jgi:hypothetical protein
MTRIATPLSHLPPLFYGDVEILGQVLLGQVLLGQVLLGQVLLGHVWLGHVRLGHVLPAPLPCILRIGPPNRNEIFARNNLPPANR